MKYKPRSYRRSVRKEQILKQLRIWHENGYATESTSYKLARALELRPSAHFTNILIEMVNSGDLVRTFDAGLTPLGTYFYALNKASDSYHEKYGKRRIVVNVKGKPAGQLELAL